ncbi:MAG: BCCT family transporter [Myxococcota bacterium]
MNGPRAAWPALAVVVASLGGFLVAAAVDFESTSAWVASSFAWVADGWGAAWQWLLLVNLLVAVGLAASPWGRIRLGGAKAPSMSTHQWVAVLFCTLLAGGGVFFSAAEPSMHLGTPPPVFADRAAGSLQAAYAALAQSYLHWGFLAWSIVGTCGAIVMLREHERGAPLRPSTLLRPLLGRYAEQPILAGLVDGVSMVAALVGTIGPLGFLGLQLAYALEVKLGVSGGLQTQVLVIALLVAVAATSAALGIERGIAVLSRLNVGLACVAFVLLIALGPTTFLGQALAHGLADYAAEFPVLALTRSNPAWLRGWTVFYWAWFLGYGPVMAVFVAKVSQGRTVRELVIGVGVLAPLATNLWFTALGGTGMGLELLNPGVVSGALSEGGMPAALFAILDQLPASGLLTVIFVVLVFAFLATSADSIAFTTAMVTSGQADPPRWMRVGWALVMGLVASVLVAMGEGSVTALQSLIVLAAPPVSLIMAAAVIGAPLSLRRSS